MRELYLTLTKDRSPLPAVLQRRVLAVATTRRDQTLLAALAERVDLDPDVEATLVATGAARVLSAWLSRPGRDRTHLLAAARDRRVTVRAAVAAVRGLDDEVYTATIGRGEAAVLRALTENRSVSDEVLSQLLVRAVTRDPVAFLAELTSSDGRRTIHPVLQRCVDVQTQVCCALLDHDQVEARRLVRDFGDLPGLTASQHATLVEAFCAAPTRDRWNYSAYELEEGGWLLTSPHATDATWAAIDRAFSTLGPDRNGPAQITGLVGARDVAAVNHRYHRGASAAARRLAAKLPTVTGDQLAAYVTEVAAAKDLDAGEANRLFTAVLDRADLSADAVHALPVWAFAWASTTVERRLGRGDGDLAVDVLLALAGGKDALASLLAARGPEVVPAVCAALGDDHGTVQVRTDEVLRWLLAYGQLDQLPARLLPELARADAAAVSALLSRHDDRALELAETLADGYGGSIHSLLTDASTLADAAS